MYIETGFAQTSGGGLKWIECTLTNYDVIPRLHNHIREAAVGAERGMDSASGLCSIAFSIFGPKGQGQCDNPTYVPLSFVWNTSPPYLLSVIV